MKIKIKKLFLCLGISGIVPETHAGPVHQLLLKIMNVKQCRGAPEKAEIAYRMLDQLITAGFEIEEEQRKLGGHLKIGDAVLDMGLLREDMHMAFTLPRFTEMQAYIKKCKKQEQKKTIENEKFSLESLEEQFEVLTLEEGKQKATTPFVSPMPGLICESFAHSLGQTLKSVKKEEQNAQEAERQKIKQTLDDLKMIQKNLMQQEVPDDSRENEVYDVITKITQRAIVSLENQCQMKQWADEGLDGAQSDLQLAPYRNAFASRWLFFRPLIPSDAPVFFGFFQDKSYIQFFGLGKTKTQEEVENLFNALSAHNEKFCDPSSREKDPKYQTGQKYYYHWVAIAKDKNGRPVIAGRFSAFFSVDATEVAFCALKECSGKGITKMMVPIFIEKMGGLFIATAHQKNAPSRAVLKSAGFSEILPSLEQQEIFKKKYGADRVLYRTEGDIEDRKF